MCICCVTDNNHSREQWQQQQKVISINIVCIFHADYGVLQYAHAVMLSNASAVQCFCCVHDWNMYFYPYCFID